MPFISNSPEFWPVIASNYLGFKICGVFRLLRAAESRFIPETVAASAAITIYDYGIQPLMQRVDANELKCHLPALVFRREVDFIWVRGLGKQYFVQLQVLTYVPQCERWSITTILYVVVRLLSHHTTPA